MKLFHEVATDAFFIGFKIDSCSISDEAMPVSQHRRKRRQQSLRGWQLRVSRTLWFDHAQHRTTGSQHVHRVSRRWNFLKRFSNRRGQSTLAAKSSLETVELFNHRQFAVEQQECDFFECAMFG